MTQEAEALDTQGEVAVTDRAASSQHAADMDQSLVVARVNAIG